MMQSYIDTIPELDEDAIGLLAEAIEGDPMRSPEAAVLPHLADGARYQADGIRRTCRDAQKVSKAVEAIGALPGPAEAIHLIGGGQFSLMDMLPAMLALAGERIGELYLASLSFSKDNTALLAEMLDTGQIGRCTMLVSHYFRATSAPIAEGMMQALDQRHQRYVVARSHVKVLALQFASGRTLVVESSANLRSKANLEQFTLSGDPGLYRFHAGWIDRLYTQSQEAHE